MQTQTQLFLPGGPLGGTLKHSHFSMSNVSFETETQREGPSIAKNILALESEIQFIVNRLRRCF